MKLRPDLEPQIMAGKLSLHAALMIATAKPKATSYDRLLAAWNNATDSDRLRLLEALQ